MAKQRRTGRMPAGLARYWKKKNASSRPRRASSSPRRTPKTMARRRTSRKSYSRRGGSRRSFGANTGSLINGAFGGAAARLATGYLGPTYGPAAGLAAVGMWKKDATLQTLAGVAIGSTLAGGLPNLPGAGSTAAPGGFL